VIRFLLLVVIGSLDDSLTFVARKPGSQSFVRRSDLLRVSTLLPLLNGTVLEFYALL